jgi:aspartyl-tRNA(Asn)/glutamyl-tRNA(Gln) amidotransferase subunit C
MESAIDVAYVARLARLNLTAEEAQLFQKQLGDVLAEAEKLKEIDVSGIDVAAHGVAIFNILRDDVAREGLTVEEALSNAPRQAAGLFIVTRVVE